MKESGSKIGGSMFDGKEYVYEVFQEKSFSKAAQKLYISQPALSTAIKKVEKKIGKPIFDRSTSPISLTPSGEIYIDAIGKLFTLEQNTLNQLDNLNGLLAGRLSVGGTNFFTAFILPGLLGRFSRKYPNIRIELQEGTTMQLTERLLDEELDLILDNSEFRDKNYEKYAYCPERIILAVPESFDINRKLTKYQLSSDEIQENRHGDADFPELPLKMLGDVPLIMLKEENSIYKRGARMFALQDYQPNIILKPDSVVTAFNMACTGVGATLIPDGLVRNLPYGAPLCYYKMNEQLALRHINIYKKKNKYMSKAMEEFIRIAVGDEAYEEALLKNEKQR